MTTDSIGENDMGEPGVVEPRTEADMVGSGMARIAGRTIHELEARIKALEFQIDVANDPHTRLCATQRTGSGRDCTCGWKPLMFPEPAAAIASLRSDGETR